LGKIRRNPKSPFFEKEALQIQSNENDPVDAGLLLPAEMVPENRSVNTVVIIASEAAAIVLANQGAGIPLVVYR